MLSRLIDVHASWCGVARFHKPASAWCTEATTIEPSPTAEATRLIDPGSHVTDSENAGTAGGQRLRQRLRVRRVVADGRYTRAHKSFVVQGDAGEPLGVGRGPEHEKHIRNMAGLGLPGNPVAPGN